MKTEKNIKPVSDIEWDTCWMAIRYAMNRQTIASATLPTDLIKAYWHRWTDDQKRQIAKDLKQNEEYYSTLKITDEKAFGNENIDRPVWIKFMNACDIDNHHKGQLKDGSTYEMFQVHDKLYPLKQYLNDPTLDIFQLQIG